VIFSGLNPKQAKCLGYIIMINIIYCYCHYYHHFFHLTTTAVPIHARPNPVLTLAIVECLRKPSRPWHAPAVLRFVSAQATGSAHHLKKDRTKTDSRENCRGPQHPTRMCRAWMPAGSVCCRWQQRAGDSGAAGTAAHEPPSVADPRELAP
jgi:hypothetical protein